MKKTVKTIVTKLPEGFAVESKTGTLKVIMDRKTADGGEDKGMTPMELVLSALGGCQAICAYAFAPSQGVELKGFHVEIEGDYDSDATRSSNQNVRTGYSEIRFKMHFKTDSPEEKVKALAEMVEKRCPVGDCLENEVKLVQTGIVIE